MAESRSLASDSWIQMLASISSSRGVPVPIPPSLASPDHLRAQAEQCSSPQVKQLRLEREREKAMREQELELLQREKEAEHFKTWEEQEDSFHLQQAKLRYSPTTSWDHLPTPSSHTPCPLGAGSRVLTTSHPLRQLQDSHPGWASQTHRLAGQVHQRRG